MLLILDQSFRDTVLHLLAQLFDPLLETLIFVFVYQLLLQNLPLNVVDNNLDFTFYPITYYVPGGSLFSDLEPEGVYPFNKVLLCVADHVIILNVFRGILYLLQHLSRLCVQLILHFGFKLGKSALPCRV